MSRRSRSTRHTVEIACSGGGDVDEDGAHSVSAAGPMPASRRLQSQMHKTS